MSCRQQAGKDKQFMHEKKGIKIKKILKVKKKAIEVKTKSAAPWDIMSDYQDLIAGIFFFSLSLALYMYFCPYYSHVFHTFNKHVG